MKIISKVSENNSNQKELLDILTVHSLLVIRLHLSLCRHCPLLKYSRCLTLSLFVVTRCSPFLVAFDFGIISTPLLIIINYIDSVLHKNLGHTYLYNTNSWFCLDLIKREYIYKLILVKEIVLIKVSNLALFVFISTFYE